MSEETPRSMSIKEWFGGLTLLGLFLGVLMFGLVSPTLSHPWLPLFAFLWCAVGIPLFCGGIVWLAATAAGHKRIPIR